MKPDKRALLSADQKSNAREFTGLRRASKLRSGQEVGELLGAT